MAQPTDPTDMFGLEGRTVLITGAGGGIGQSLVRIFRAAGASVIGADRDPALLESLDVDRRLVFDLTDAQATQAAMARLLEEGVVPDVLVGNAGWTRADRLDQVDQAAWDRELAINLTGSYRVAAPLVEAMAKRRHGSVVFIASVNGLAHYGNAAYAAAKAGLIAYAKALAVERGAAGVRVNVVCPGSVRTAAWDHRFAADTNLADRLLPHYPIGRLVEADEVARATLFLASAAASGITGAVLPVDGGLTAGNARFIGDVLIGGA